MPNETTDNQFGTPLTMAFVAIIVTYIFGLEDVEDRRGLLWRRLAGWAARGHGVPPGCVYGTHAWRKSQLDVVHCYIYGYAAAPDSDCLVQPPAPC